MVHLIPVHTTMRASELCWIYRHEIVHLHGFVKVVLNLAAEKRGKHVSFPRPGTNRTWLQLIRSCTFLLDPGVPISGSECGVSLEPDGFSDVRMCVKEQVGIKWV